MLIPLDKVGAMRQRVIPKEPIVVSGRMRRESRAQVGGGATDLYSFTRRVVVSIRVKARTK